MNPEPQNPDDGRLAGRGKTDPPSSREYPFGGTPGERFRLLLRETDRIFDS